MAEGESVLAVLAKDEAMQKRRRATADPLRMRMVWMLSGADGLTAKELADRLRLEPNRLYYHLRILEDAGVIAVVDHRVVGRLAERVYKVVYTGRYVWDAEDPVDLAMNLGAILEITKADAEATLYEQARRVEQGEESPVVTWGHPSFATTRAEMNEFAQRLDALQQEFRQRARARTEAAGVEPSDHKHMWVTWVVYEHTEGAGSEEALDERAESG